MTPRIVEGTAGHPVALAPSDSSVLTRPSSTTAARGPAPGPGPATVAKANAPEETIGWRCSPRSEVLSSACSIRRAVRGCAGSDRSEAREANVVIDEPSVPSDPPEQVEMGHCIFALHEPHHGHEAGFNRWYERDHMYAAALVAPWTLAGERWAATRELKDLRYPADGPFDQPSDRGSFLTMFWIQAGKLEEQQLWVSKQTAILAEQGRTYEDRDVQTATTYDYCGGALRDDDGVPPAVALDHRYPGVVWTWLERDPAVAFERVRDWVLGELPPCSPMHRSR